MSGRKMEEVRALKELVSEQMELSLVVEVMAVGDGNREPSVIFHQLFGDFNINFKFAQSQGEVDHLAFQSPASHTDGKELVGSRGVLENMVQNLREKVEQGHSGEVVEAYSALRMQEVLGDIINSLRSGVQ